MPPSPRPAARARRRRLTALLALAGLVLGAVACGSDDGAAADGGDGSGGDDVVELRVGVQRNFGIGSLLWQRDDQIPGVRITYTYFANPADQTPAYNAGQVDIIEHGEIGPIQIAAGGADPKAVACTEPNDQSIGLVVPGDSDATSIADLVGGRIGFLKPSNHYLFFLGLIEEAGLSESDFETVDITGPDGNAAFASGELDAYSTIEPNLSNLVAETGGRVLDTIEGYGNNLYCYLATADALAEKPEAVRAFVAHVADTLQWAKENPEEHAEIIAEEVGFRPEAVIESDRKAADRLQPIDDAFREEISGFIDRLHAAGIIDRKPDPADIFLSDFNDAIGGTGGGDGDG